MPIKELQELMKLMGWNRTRLAASLDLTSHAIDKWFAHECVPSGPASILLRDWLVRARQGEPLRASEKVPA